MNDVDVELGGIALRLCPERCAFRPDRRELLVADVHLGKASTFRRASRPLPHGTTRSELARLDRVIERTGAERLTFLGDLFHADVPEFGPTSERIADWLGERRWLTVTLIEGNHDRHASERIAALPLHSASEGAIVDGLEYRHHPLTSSESSARTIAHVAGHVHPGARVDDGKDSMKLPAFRLRPNALLLPSFGEFTGLFILVPEPADRILVATPTSVVEVPNRILRRR